MMVATVWLAPVRPPALFGRVLLYPVDSATAEKLFYTFLFVVCFINYVVFGVLTVYSIQVAYRLRHGEALYAENCKKGVQKQIDRLTKKFPGLANNQER